MVCLAKRARKPTKRATKVVTCLNVTTCENKARYIHPTGPTSRSTGHQNLCHRATDETPCHPNQAPRQTAETPGGPNQAPRATAETPGRPNQAPTATAETPGGPNRAHRATGETPCRPNQAPEPPSKPPVVQIKRPGPPSKLPVVQIKRPGPPPELPVVQIKRHEPPQKPPGGWQGRSLRRPCHVTPIESVRAVEDSDPATRRNPLGKEGHLEVMLLDVPSSRLKRSQLASDVQVRRVGPQEQSRFLPCGSNRRCGCR